MKIAGIVVLYNPELEILDNLNTYLPIVDKLYVVDNSTKNVDFVYNLKEIDKVDYISMDGNEGIAKALKISAEKACQEGFDFLLAMDQDSKFPLDDFGYIKEYLETQDVSNLGIVAINFTGSNIAHSLQEKKQTISVNEVITSGSFLNLHNYKNIDGYNEDLFIDFVDDDICYQFKLKNFDVLLFPNIVLQHSIGNKKIINVFGIKKKIVSHSSIRYYYMYRNYNYLRKFKNKEYVRLLNSKDNKFTFLHFIKRVLFEKPRIQNLKMILRGVRDGRKGRLGPYEARR